MAKKRRPKNKGWKGWGRPRRDRGKVPSLPEPKITLPKVAPAPRNQTWAQAAGQRETAVYLEQLPPGVEFRDDFPEPIRYDPARRLLIYRGFMYRGSFDYLHQRSDDPAYVAALDQLYAQSAQPAWRGRRWLWAVGVLALTALAVVAWWLRGR